MSRIRRLFKKDRYCIVRGGVILAVLILACVFMFTRIILNYSFEVECERASAAAQQVSAHLEQMLDASFVRLEGTAAQIGEDDDPTGPLRDMVQYSVFSSAEVIPGFTGESGEDNRVISQGDGGIRLQVPTKSGACLSATLDMDHVNEILSGAFDGEYSYSVYNVSTGAFLVNQTHFTSGGYYDALLHLNENGEVEELLNSANGRVRIDNAGNGGEPYYIAQLETAIKPWGIAMFIPEKLVQETNQSVRSMPYISIAAAFVLLAMLGFYTYFAMKRISISNRNAARAISAGDRMIDVAAKDAGVTLMVYNRGIDCLMACFDGMGLKERANLSDGIHSMADIAEACGMSDTESVRLYAKLSELEKGGESEFLTRCSLAGQDERILRFAFYTTQDDEKSVICSISDCTQELESQNRAEVEHSYQASMQTKASSIWQINVSKNRWCMLSSKRDDAMRALRMTAGEWHDYSADLSGQVREYVHPADYESYEECMSIASIAAMLRSGRTEFSQDYRVRGQNASNYEWHRMKVRIWLDPESNDVIANLYIFNVNAEKNAELERGERKRVLHQALTAIGGIYSGLYYVDLENDLSYTARPLDGDPSQQLCTQYSSTFEQYVQNNVHPDDQEMVRDIISTYKLRRNMTEGSRSRRCDYLRKKGDDYAKAAIIVQPARFENGSVKEVVVAIRYYDK